MIKIIILIAVSGNLLMTYSLCRAAKKADTLYTALRSKRDKDERFY